MDTLPNRGRVELLQIEVLSRLPFCCLKLDGGKAIWETEYQTAERIRCLPYFFISFLSFRSSTVVRPTSHLRLLSTTLSISIGIRREISACTGVTSICVIGMARATCAISK